MHTQLDGRMKFVLRRLLSWIVTLEAVAATVSTPGSSFRTFDLLQAARLASLHSVRACLPPGISRRGQYGSSHTVAPFCKPSLISVDTIDSRPLVPRGCNSSNRVDRMSELLSRFRRLRTNVSIATIGDFWERLFHELRVSIK